MSAVPAGHDDTPDPDEMDVVSLHLVREAAGLLRESTVARPEALEAAVQRVKVEAVLGALLGAVGGSFGRVAHAMPDLMGLVEQEDSDG